MWLFGVATCIVGVQLAMVTTGVKLPVNYDSLPLHKPASVVSNHMLQCEAHLISFLHLGTLASIYTYTHVLVRVKFYTDGHCATS